MLTVKRRLTKSEIIILFRSSNQRQPNWCGFIPWRYCFLIWLVIFPAATPPGFLRYSQWYVYCAMLCSLFALLSWLPYPFYTLFSTHLSPLPSSLPSLLSPLISSLSSLPSLPSTWCPLLSPLISGPAWKVSRRQGIIKLKTNGDFFISNEGQRSIYVDGAPVSVGAKCQLANNAVVEIAGLRFIFLVNTDLINIVRSEAAKTLCWGSIDGAYGEIARLRFIFLINTDLINIVKDALMQCQRRSRWNHRLTHIHISSSLLKYWNYYFSFHFLNRVLG